jgi:hypothetical protein
MSVFIDSRQSQTPDEPDNGSMQMPAQPERTRRLRPANNGRRIRREKRTIEAMLDVYCRGHHATDGPGRDGLCADCADLLRYAHQRLDNCVFGELKSPCNDCTSHCYSGKMRPRVVEVIRYSGTRMTLRYPLLGLLHMLDKLRPCS